MPRKNKPHSVAPATALDKTLSSMTDEHGRTTAPTPEWRAKNEMRVVEASREGKWTDKQASTVRRQSPIDTWERNGWLSQQGAAKMRWWWDLNLTANYDRVRSCCDDTPRSGVGSLRPERMIDAGREHARLRGELVSAIGVPMTRCLVHFLSHDGTLAEAYRDAFAPLRNADVWALAQKVVVASGAALERVK